MTAHPIVDRYVEAVNRRDLEATAALFAEAAHVTNPIGTFAGVEAISGFYRDVVFAGEAVLGIGTVLAEGTTVMAELRATSPLDPEGGTLHAIDVFRLADDGRIASLEIYYR